MIRFVLGLVLACPCVLVGQTLPRVAFEMAAGSGPHSERAGETWFNDTPHGIFRIGGLIRGATFGSRVAAIARVEYSVPGMGDRVSVCGLAPNMTCRQYFPETDGLAIGLGALAAATSRVLIETEVGALRSAANRYVAVNASYALFSHGGAVGDCRYYDLSYAAGPNQSPGGAVPAVHSRVFFRPAQLGVRVFQGRWRSTHSCLTIHRAAPGSDRRAGREWLE